MIIYRDQRSTADTRKLLARARSGLDELSAASSHQQIVELLIALGTLESALADALFPEVDAVHPTIDLLRQASVAAGHMLWHSWHGQPHLIERWAKLATDALSQVVGQALPKQVEISAPEGYAYYGVYPEMYLEAAISFAQPLQRSSAVCLGLRSIGSSLSAVVAAALEELGWSVQSWTLRPRGHPFERTPRLGPELDQKLRSTSDSRFLVIDEGPGISGSSFVGTGAMLRQLGIPQDRITLFPSWRTKGSQLRSPTARNQWSSYEQVVTTFESVWLDSGRLTQAFPGMLTDLSAGSWRRLMYQSSACFPAVQPQHERRKYLLRPAETTSAGQPPLLLKFAGLGAEARANVLRGKALAEAGFSPAPVDLCHGFMATTFIEGKPVPVGHTPGEFLQRVAQYLAHLACAQRAEPTVTDAELREMTTVNLNEALDTEEFRRLGRLLPRKWTEWPVALDARMQSHEWLQTATGYVKTDTIDHHRDHFFPGCQDIAWDIAGAALELGLDRSGRSFVLSEYRRLSHDHTITRRLPHYAIAYLAFRIGYATLALEVLGSAHEDGQRFRTQAERYRRLLSESSAASSPHFWDV
jgi:hypothetical protein